MSMFDLASDVWDNVSGTRGVRHPYVTLKFDTFEIPLLDAKVGVTNPGAEDSGNFVQPLFLQSMQYERAVWVDGSNQMTLRILDPSFDYLTGLIFTKAAAINFTGLTVEFGWRWVNGIKRALTRSPVPLLLLDVSLEVHPNRGTLVILDMVDQFSDLWVGSHHSSFDESATASSVITEAVRKYHPSLKVEVEPMSTPIGEMKNMEGSSVGTFIKNILEFALPSVGNKKNPVFATKVEPPTESAGHAVLRIYRAKAEEARREYVFGRHSQGEMLDFQPSINLRSMAHIAGGRATAVSVDGATKTWARAESTMRDDTDLDGPRRSQTTPQQPTSNFMVPLSPNDATSFIDGVRTNADIAQWDATATIMGDPNLEPYDRIKIIVLKNPPTGKEVNHADANAIYWAASGLWQIQTVTHHIEDGQFHTLLTLFRNAGFEGEGADGIPVTFKFDLVATDKNGKVTSRISPLDNPDRLTSPGGTWQI